MEKIDAEWVSDHLTGRHGEKAELAEFVGIDTDKLSKVLSGTRKIQIEEAPRFYEFFYPMDERIKQNLTDPELQEFAYQWSELTPQEKAALRFSLKGFLDQPDRPTD